MAIASENFLAVQTGDRRGGYFFSGKSGDPGLDISRKVIKFRRTDLA
ncbi:hypothetical protein H6G72_27240 [Planktothricoides sp. FACHB-1370]|uniref:Uncharacterized protein n=1 Tax=Planktothricoides raciborskii FACHB-1370 TaxID=2949576 RepID=A0ABR8EPC8_9CYAN|nr:hypothetical protein [Planktothricoides sp. SR001]MBD2547456.1 hypothetical protein [Planktothricoides raciborskii FACHB-1370]